MRYPIAEKQQDNNDIDKGAGQYKPVKRIFWKSCASTHCHIHPERFLKKPDAVFRYETQQNKDPEPGFDPI